MSSFANQNPLKPAPVLRGFFSYLLPKLRVAGSSLVFRSINTVKGLGLSRPFLICNKIIKIYQNSYHYESVAE